MLMHSGKGNLSKLLLMSRIDWGIGKMGLNSEIQRERDIPQDYFGIKYNLSTTRDYTNFPIDFISIIRRSLKEYNYLGRVGSPPCKSFNSEVYFFALNNDKAFFVYSPTDDLNSGFGIWFYLNSLHPKFEDVKLDITNFMENNMNKSENFEYVVN
ncbi:MAG TPA: hypothetical protein VJZ93_00090 [Candidatus Nanoarchaeia archaeon]|nr:hypothetical protein [Candidatus Nanoarchaeia archaeon]